MGIIFTRNEIQKGREWRGSCTGQCQSSWLRDGLRTREPPTHALYGLSTVQQITRGADVSQVKREPGKESVLTKKSKAVSNSEYGEPPGWHPPPRTRS